MVELDQINENKHIVLIANNETFSLANVLYTYILTLHKKVSLVATQEIDKKFVFLPWFDKVRKIVPSSGDIKIELNLDTLRLYQEFQSHSIKMNEKIATSFYSSFLVEDGLKSILCEDKKLSAMSELITLGADCKTCNEFLKSSKSLALFRLKSLLFANFVLKNEAKVVEVYIDEAMLKQSGAKLTDALLVAQELLEIIHVHKVVLIQKDENKILKEIKVEN
ncbi:hypothetical protein [Sulfurimonas sp.]|uniref:hypothetical protein n=1 Tax=Sulfurimonas sp. TaxID=2022749 RepID=UPI003D118323